MIDQMKRPLGEWLCDVGVAFLMVIGPGALLVIVLLSMLGRLPPA